MYFSTNLLGHSLSLVCRNDLLSHPSSVSFFLDGKWGVRLCDQDTWSDLLRRPHPQQRSPNFPNTQTSVAFLKVSEKWSQKLKRRMNPPMKHVSQEQPQRSLMKFLWIFYALQEREASKPQRETITKSWSVFIALWIFNSKSPPIEKFVQAMGPNGSARRNTSPWRIQWRPAATPLVLSLVKGHKRLLSFSSCHQPSWAVISMCSPKLILGAFLYNNWKSPNNLEQSAGGTCRKALCFIISSCHLSSVSIFDFQTTIQQKWQNFEQVPRNDHQVRESACWKERRHLNWNIQTIANLQIWHGSKSEVAEHFRIW